MEVRNLEWVEFISQLPCEKVVGSPLELDASNDKSPLSIIVDRQYAFPLVAGLRHSEVSSVLAEKLLFLAEEIFSERHRWSGAVPVFAGRYGCVSAGICCCAIRSAVAGGPAENCSGACAVRSTCDDDDTATACQLGNGNGNAHTASERHGSGSCQTETRSRCVNDHNRDTAMHIVQCRCPCQQIEQSSLAATSACTAGHLNHEVRNQGNGNYSETAPTHTPNGNGHASSSNGSCLYTNSLANETSHKQCRNLANCCAFVISGCNMCHQSRNDRAIDQFRNSPRGKCHDVASSRGCQGWRFCGQHCAWRRCGHRAVVVGSLAPLAFITRSDWEWYCLLMPLVIQAAKIEGLLAWLSTLGGAYSALGDCIPQHALHAESVSLEQLSLAISVGDPCLVSRCWLFLALSYLQQERLGEAQRIIRSQRMWLRVSPRLRDDLKLVALFTSTVNRLRYATRLVSATS